MIKTLLTSTFVVAMTAQVAFAGSDPEFTTYNLDVTVGSTIHILDYVNANGQSLGGDFYFAYDDGESWHLSDFNANTAVPLINADLDGGNHGPGEYRIYMMDAHDPDSSLDHMTIRVTGSNGAVPDAPQTIELTGIVRDFKISHPDMQYPNKSFGVKTNLVDATLDAGSKPVLRTDLDPHRGMIDGPDSFNQWFRDVPEVNISIPYPIILQLAQDGSGVYSYAREKQLTGDLKYFFPIDGMGWNDSQSTSTGTHNFYFTYEIHTEFSYSDPSDRDYEMIFSFTGDDDVWVFINGILAVDIGGVHGQATRSINLDNAAAQLGLQPGGTYTLDFFFAERHTTESNFRIETTLQLIEVPPTTISPLYD